jgi:hypothetical protein
MNAVMRRRPERNAKPGRLAAGPLPLREPVPRITVQVVARHRGAPSRPGGLRVGRACPDPPLTPSWRDPGGDCNLNGVTPETGEASVTVVMMDVSAEPAESSDEQLVRQLVGRARAEGLKLTGRVACWAG